MSIVNVTDPGGITTPPSSGGVCPPSDPEATPPSRPCPGLRPGEPASDVAPPSTRAVPFDELLHAAPSASPRHGSQSRPSGADRRGGKMTRKGFAMTDLAARASQATGRPGLSLKTAPSVLPLGGRA